MAANKRKVFFMRRLVGLVLVAAVLYGGYWVVGSRATLAGVRQALAQMKAEGLADYADVSIRGFPSRFDLTIDQPRFRSADGLTEWVAPFAQIFALSYRPNHIIAVLPQQQTLTLAGAPLQVTSDDMRGSAVFGASTMLPLDHAQTVAKEVIVTGPSDGFALTELRAAVRTADTAQNSYDIAAEVSGLSPTGEAQPIWALVAGDAAAKGWLKAETTATFDRPLDRQAAEAGVRMTGLQVSNLQASYGQFQLRGTGALTVTLAGVPEGKIDLEVRGWQGLPQVMVETGLIKPEVAPTVAKMLEALAVGSGSSDGTLRLPLTMTDGRMALGPIPLGPAPQF